MAGDPIECDVCSQILSQTEISSHVLLHLSQISRLCKSLAHPAPESNEDLQPCDDGIDDAESHCSATDQDSLMGRSDQPFTTPLKSFKCPTCDHGAFRRRQELVRHFARHYAINNSCDRCSTTFYQASKYIWHRCEQDAAAHQKAYKRRWQSLRKDVGRALDQASDMVCLGKRRKELRSSQQRKKRKTAHSGDPSMIAAAQNAPLRLPEETGPEVEGEASLSNAALQLISGTSLLQVEGSDQSSGPAGTDANFPQSHHVTDYSSAWHISSSDAPIIWDNWNWPDTEPWVPDSQNQAAV